jgi:hypothetical protein
MPPEKAAADIHIIHLLFIVKKKQQQKQEKTH